MVRLKGVRGINLFHIRGYDMICLSESFNPTYQSKCYGNCQDEVLYCIPQHPLNIHPDVTPVEAGKDSLTSTPRIPHYFFILPVSSPPHKGDR